MVVVEPLGVVTAEGATRLDEVDVGEMAPGADEAPGDFMEFWSPGQSAPLVIAGRRQHCS